MLTYPETLVVFYSKLQFAFITVNVTMLSKKIYFTDNVQYGLITVTYP